MDKSSKDSSEMDVIFKLISPMLDKLGYKENVIGEIEHEKSVPIGNHKYVFPDIVVNINKIPVMVIDGKAPTENLDLYERQIISYGLLLKTPYSVLSNGATIRVYETQSEMIIWERPINEIPTFLSKDNLVRKIGKTIETVTEERLEKARKTLLVFAGIEEFSSVLSKCEDIIRDVDGLTGADAFDEISKLLFAKMYFEKKFQNGKASPFSLEGINNNGGANYVRIYLFHQARDDNRDIFIGNEEIKLKDESIIKLVEILQNYTLIKTDVDVKGRAFEIFLGRTFTGGLGQFFTPRTIVRFAVEFADPEINSVVSERNDPYLILDPACGSGGFLIEVFKAIQEKIVKQPTEKQDRLNKRLSTDQIYGTDINERLVRVAKMNMVLHGDGHGRIYQANGLDKTSKIEEEKFDLVITNPPFGNKDTGKILEQFNLGTPNGKKIKEQLREILFVEKCLRFLKPAGELAILLPDGILNNEHLTYVRDYIRENTIIKAVISLPDRAFKASGANSKTSLLFLKKRSKKDEEQLPIFMAIAEFVGYETKTKDAKPIEHNDLPQILKTYREYKASKFFENLHGKIEALEILSTIPASFLIGSEYVKDRIDATYYYAKHIFELKGESCRVEDVASPSRRIISPQNQPDKTIKYIQYSNVDKTLGDVTSHLEMIGDDAPSRARLLVSKGEIIAAKVKDSEENVTMIPDEYDGAIVSSGFIVLKPIAPMTSEALFVLLRLQSTYNQVRWKSSGTILPAISDDEYMTIKIPKLGQNDIDTFTKEIKRINEQRAQIKNKLKQLSLEIKE